MSKQFKDGEVNKLGKFTEKEIYEIPDKLQILIESYETIVKIARNIIDFNTKHIYLLGAGSSYHAGFAISYMFNRISKIPTYCEYSMEFQYLIEPILDSRDCIIAISQSGETKDTIESIKLAKDSKKCLIIAITNNDESQLAKLCDHSIFLNCGEEKSVLATKTYINQLASLSILALEIAIIKKSVTKEDYKIIWDELKQIPTKIKNTLPKLHNSIKQHSNYFKFAEFCFILGGGPDYATAKEASLKLKEGARIFGQAYSTAEFPHGPITLADSKAWILAIIPHENDQRKKNLLNLLARIKERKATILGVFEGDLSETIPEQLDFGIAVPNTINDLQPLVMILAVQLLTLEIARIKGINSDSPKFLTKVSGI
ncbi:MAG: SIS domain-containing protein [Candidatus Lokiarchaeota archaeon]|nr:SIS domain-containing protein [Candidatus Lokiarchaeota archaeon]MBD3199038.1 SIS domain-containing protein [Candidatus Lokiarchaeota archaeon]